jgi:cyclase
MWRRWNTSEVEMDSDDLKQLLTRREWLQSSALIAGGSLISGLIPARLLAFPQQKAPTDPVAAMRAQMAAAPIQAQRLGENLTLLSGPGGNVVVLNGPDGKLMIDTFVQPAWPQLKEHLASIGKAPLKQVIDTHWHFDHTDNNAHVRAAGASILAHENTKARMSQAHDLVPLGLHFPPSPADALPQKTFATSEKMQVNGKELSLGYVPPAHTDSDIFIHFQKANVLHTGDVFFNGFYPFIDGGTRGSVHGIIAGATKLIAIADSKTKIVPGHGPLGDKASFIKYRDMLAAIHDNVEKQKAAGKSLKEVVAAKPTSAFDAQWGKGLFTPDQFAAIAYNTL